MNHSHEQMQSSVSSQDSLMHRRAFLASMTRSFALATSVTLLASHDSGNADDLTETPIIHANKNTDADSAGKKMNLAKDVWDLEDGELKLGEGIFFTIEDEQRNRHKIEMKYSKDGRSLFINDKEFVMTAGLVSIAKRVEKRGGTLYVDGSNVFRINGWSAWTPQKLESMCKALILKQEKTFEFDVYIGKRHTESEHPENEAFSKRSGEVRLVEPEEEVPESELEFVDE